MQMTQHYLPVHKKESGNFSKILYKKVHATTYDTIRYDSVYLTCSKKLTGSQLSPPQHVYQCTEVQNNGGQQTRQYFSASGP